MSDIEIARAARLRPITDIATGLGLEPDDIDLYGAYKAKVRLDALARLRDRPDGALVLVTAMTPTPAGEDKSTTTVGLGDAFRRLGRGAIVAIREPSLGPCFTGMGARRRRRCRAGPNRTRPHGAGEVELLPKKPAAETIDIDDDGNVVSEIGRSSMGVPSLSRSVHEAIRRWLRPDPPDAGRERRGHAGSSRRRAAHRAQRHGLEPGGGPEASREGVDQA